MANKQDPVDNHGVTIATDGTGHVAKIKPANTDICFNANNQPIVYGDNYQPSSKLGTNKTTKTLINNHHIWTEPGLLDAGPSAPAHAGTNGGVNDGTHPYTKHASVQKGSCSKDVIIEQHGVVRTNDETYQNRFNAKGFVDGSKAHAEEDDLDAAKRPGCTIIHIKGKCSHRGEGKGAAGDRTFGLTPPRTSATTVWNGVKNVAGQAVKLQSLPGMSPVKAEGAPEAAKPMSAGEESVQVYLAVYGGDKLTLEVDREDATKKPSKKPPVCEMARQLGKPAHTHWTAVTTGNMCWVVSWKDKTDEHIGDTWVYTVPGGKTASVKGAEKEDGLAHVGPGAKDANRESSALEAQARKNAGRNATAAAENPLLSKGQKSALGTAASIGKNLAKAYQIWCLETSPPTCTITALSCAGAKVLTVQIFPEEEFAFDLMSEDLKAKLAWLKGVKTGFEWVSKNIGSAGGITVPFKFELLQKPKLELKIQYKELTEDKNGKLKDQVGAAWNFCFGFEPFVYVELELSVPLFKVLSTLGNAATPAAAAALALVGWVLGKCGVQGNFVFRGSLEIKPDIELGADEYGEFKWLKAGECDLIATLFIGFEAIAPGLVFEAGLYTEGKVTLGDWARPAEKDRATQLFTFTARGQLQFGAKGTVTVDFLKWVTSKPVGTQFDWRPKCLRFPEAEGKKFGTYFCPMPQSGTTAEPDPTYYG